MENNAASLNQTSDGKSLFTIASGTPVIAPARMNIGLITLVAAILSFALGLFVAASRQYLR